MKTTAKHAAMRATKSLKFLYGYYLFKKTD